MDLKECPFCKSRSINYILGYGSMVCDGCGCVGPISKEESTKEIATKLWNQRGLVEYSFESLEELDASYD